MRSRLNPFTNTFIRHKAKQLLTILRWQRHRRTLQRVLGRQPADYQAYLDVQLKRTVSKQDAPLQLRTRILVDAVANHVDLRQSRVLCVGCRNANELDYISQRGAREVVGIDLFSTDPRIQIMDMHHMTFPDNSFDVVYSSHSLEHAHSPAQVAAEMVRVLRPGGLIALEVPVHYPGSGQGADLLDFGSVAALHQLFGDQVAGILLSQELAVNDPANGSGTPVARTLFTVR